MSVVRMVPLRVPGGHHTREVHRIHFFIPSVRLRRLPLRPLGPAAEALTAQ